LRTEALARAVVQVGDEVKVDGQKAIVIMGPDNTGNYMVRFESDGNTGGPYKVMDLTIVNEAKPVSGEELPMQKLKRLYSKRRGGGSSRRSTSWSSRMGNALRAWSSAPLLLVLASVVLLGLLLSGGFAAGRASRLHDRIWVSRPCIRGLLRHSNVGPSGAEHRPLVDVETPGCRDVGWT